VEHEHRHAAAPRRSHGAEPAGWRHHRLRAQIGGVGPGRPRDPRRRRQNRSPVFERGSRRRSGSGNGAGATLLVSPAAPAFSRRPPPSTGSRLTRPTAGPPAAGRGGLPIAAVPHRTAPAPATPSVAPGVYTVRLTADGKSYTQPLTVKMDPRVKTPAAGLQQQ